MFPRQRRELQPKIKKPEPTLEETLDAAALAQVRRRERDLDISRATAWLTAQAGEIEKARTGLVRKNKGNRNANKYRTFHAPNWVSSNVHATEAEIRGCEGFVPFEAAVQRVGAQIVSVSGHPKVAIVVDFAPSFNV